MAGPLALAGKYAKKDGCCQCVIPGRMISSTSRKNASNGSPVSGGSGGSARADVARRDLGQDGKGLDPLW